MNYLKNSKGFTTSLGICITFTLTSDSRSQVVAKGPHHHREVTVCLPEDRPERWGAIFQKAIALVENNDRWPVRIDWKNAKQFFTLEDVQKVEQALPDISFYVYNASPCKTASKFNVDALYRAKNRDKYRQQFL